MCCYPFTASAPLPWGGIDGTVPVTLFNTLQRDIAEKQLKLSDERQIQLESLVELEELRNIARDSDFWRELGRRED